MTNLSPAARATYDAFNRVGLYNEPSFETDRRALAAALRAVADQLGQELEFYNVSVVTVTDLFAIAAELEGAS